MKHPILLAIGALAFFLTPLKAQYQGSIIAGTASAHPLKNFGNQTPLNSNNLLVTAATDTLEYFFNKHFYRNASTPASAPPNQQFVTIPSPFNSTLSITHCGAIFLNASGIKVTGLQAIAARMPGSVSASVSVKLYLCNVNGSNQPILPALDSVLTNVSSLSGNWVGGDFNTPVSVTGKFAVLYKVGSSQAGDTISLFLNNACNASSSAPAAQRFGEGLGTIRINGVFYATTNVFGNGPPGNDFEFLVAARVNFGFNAGLSVLTPSICTNAAGNLVSTSTPGNLIENRQFNFNKFGAKWGGALANSLMPPTDSIYNWSFSNSAATFTTGSTASPIFTVTGNHAVTLTVKYRKSGNNAAFLTSVDDVATGTIDASYQGLPPVSLTASSNTVCTTSTNGNTITLTGSPNGGVFGGINLSGNGIFTPNTPGLLS